MVNTHVLHPYNHHNAHVILLLLALLSLSLYSLFPVSALCISANNPCSFSPLTDLFPATTCTVLGNSFIPSLATQSPTSSFSSSCLRVILGDLIANVDMTIESNLNVTGSVSCSPQTKFIVGSVYDSNGFDAAPTLYTGGDVMLPCFVTGPSYLIAKLLSINSAASVSLSYAFASPRICYYTNIIAEDSISISPGLSSTCQYLSKVKAKKIMMNIGSAGSSNGYDTSLEATSGSIYVAYDGRLFLESVTAINGNITLICSVGNSSSTGFSTKGDIAALSDYGTVEIHGRENSTTVSVVGDVEASGFVSLLNLRTLSARNILTLNGNLLIENVYEIKISGSVNASNDLFITWDLDHSCGEIVIDGNLKVNGNVYLTSRQSGFLASYCTLVIKVGGNLEVGGKIQRAGAAKLYVKGKEASVINNTPGEQGAIAGIVIACLFAIAISVYTVYRSRTKITRALIQSLPRQDNRFRDVRSTIEDPRQTPGTSIITTTSTRLSRSPIPPIQSTDAVPAAPVLQEQGSFSSIPVALQSQPSYSNIPLAEITTADQEQQAEVTATELISDSTEDRTPQNN